MTSNTGRMEELFRHQEGEASAHEVPYRKNLIFDVGNVLFHYRWGESLVDYGLSQEEVARMAGEIFEDPKGTWNQGDLGLLTRQQQIRALQEQFPEDGEIIEWFFDHGEYLHVPRPHVWKLVHQLKEAGYGIYLLSNYSEDLFAKHTQYAEFMKDLDGMMVSYMVHAVKPSPEIYQALFDKYELKPEDCLFFDDRADNVKAGEAFGMASIQVTSMEALLEDLRQLLEMRTNS